MRTAFQLLESTPVGFAEGAVRQRFNRDLVKEESFHVVGVPSKLWKADFVETMIRSGFEQNATTELSH